MTEILTESFCERCGTRYTFESSAPRTSRLGRVRTLSKGVRNFVMTDEASFSEAMAEARGEEELAATSHQLDAFHQTFNFCLTCRQYTCGDCWNGAEGRCLTCAPVPGQDEVAPADAASLASVTLEPIAETNGHEEAAPGIEAWPEMDLPVERLARVMEPPPVVAGAVDAVEAVEVAEVAEPVEVADAAGVAASAEADAGPSLIGVAPGQSLDEAIAAYEAMLATEEQGAARADEAVAFTPPPVVEPAAAQATPIAPEFDPALAAAAAGAMVQPGLAPAEAEPSIATVLAAAGLAAMAADADGRRASEAEPLVIEPERVTLATEQAPEPVAAEPGPIVLEPAPEPVAIEAVAEQAVPEAAPELAVLQAAPELAVPQTAPEPVATGPVTVATPPAAPPVDHVEQPTWPVPPPLPSTLDTGTEPAPAPTPATAPAPAPAQPPAPAPWLTVAPEDAPPPEWPAAPAWSGPANRRDVPATLAGRPLLPQGDAAALWAASAKEVLGTAPAAFGAAPQPLASSGPAPQAQPCVSCGLSLSANARFCRRCGSRQG